MSDLKQAINKSFISQSAFAHAMAFCQKQQELLQHEIDFYDSSFIRKCRLLLTLARSGLPAAEVRRMLLRLLPRRSFRTLKGWRNSFRGLIRT